MSTPSSSKIPTTAVRLVAAGLGSVAVGALCPALGVIAGGVLSAHAAKVLEKVTERSGEFLSEFGAHYCYDKFLEMREHPPLEDVLREALRGALEDVRASLTSEEAAAYADWFDNWGIRLKNRAPFSPGAIPEFRIRHSNPAAAEQALALLFERVMERLDGEARANENLSISGSRFRAMPPALLDLLTTHLPTALDARFGSLLTLPEHAGAWITVQREFQEDVRSRLSRIEGKVDAVKTDTERILEILERELVRAREAREIAEKDALAARGKAEEYERHYRKLLADVSARAEDPSEAQVAAMLASGDLDGAARFKTAQIEKRTGEIRELAHDWAELGRVHDLRFAWSQALESYQQAWRLDPDNVEYGIRYADFAYKQKRFADAIKAYREVLLRADKPAVQAAILNSLGLLYGATHRTGEAEEAYREALRIYRDLRQANSAAYLPHIAATLNNLAMLYNATQRIADSEKAYSEALQIYRTLAETDKEKYLSYVATSQNNLANLYSDAQRTKEAEQAYLEALSIRRELAVANPKGYLPYVATTLNNLGTLYRAAGRTLEAEQTLGEALAIRRDLAETNPEAYLPNVASTLNNLAILYRHMQRMDDADETYQEALRTFRDLAAANPEAYLPDVAMTLVNTAILYGRLQDTSAAEAPTREAYEILHPLWLREPALHGNLMARIFTLRARQTFPTQPAAACDFARQALAAAYDPDIKETATELIAEFCR
jgi:tetratricopeptide (TPR) repeat protein